MIVDGGELSYLILADDTGVIVVRQICKEYILAISVPPSTETRMAVGTLAQAATVLEATLGQTVVTVV